MIRRFLAREMEFLLEEFDAPDARTLWLRAAFWTYVTIVTTAVLLGVVWVGNTFGLPAMCGVVFLIFLLCVRLENRGAPGGLDWLSGPPALPPPGTKGLPPPGPPQISQSRQRALPGPK